MGKLKKFGTFSGVFTPSILTILGVIMYLRFPAIIGQAGLINTIGIIVIAHIISFSTSLSVASLATDKTVKTGGTYFMISRSLGLPIGGTLGIALFVGLSFSVSLYLIGFAESFLAYWNLDATINSVRIAGSAILILVTAITFISTSLAIKSQYFIMAAIGLSLLSIFFGHHEFTPKEVHLAPLAGAAPFMVLFGIFFPAVTGFEAGVSMSGDLKDAKKSLPLGAVGAVLVGFVVYIGLALFYSYTVDAEALRNDPQILFKISLFSPLVIAGIWGATLSSALGSILGAPRILQAISMDKIAPKIFAKGSGKTDEPRNALLLAFVIAEAGIMIGELDVIARIVSMFFITTYAFLNLACAIESWSSADFRPAFKIPKAVSIIGALSAFVIMILLDFMALVGAVFALGLLYFYLKRKELVLDKSDAWSSFWTNLAKHALLRLNKQKINMRNWRPNIILFSGGRQTRPHLIELGLALTGKLGAITNFELEVADEKIIQNESNPKEQKNKYELEFFDRKFKCPTLEDGIKTVTSVYGFSGFEPNTIMMGWSRNIQKGNFLANVLTDFRNKNLNAVLLDFDKEHGFGKKETIDIWWNGKGRVFSFGINLAKFIMSAPDWRDARLRILVINNDATITDRIHRNSSILLEEARISAEIKIIENSFENRSIEMIIKAESANTDLVILGVSSRTKKYTSEYIQTINSISLLPASLLIISPSSEFEEINLIDSVVRKSVSIPFSEEMKELISIPEIENKTFKIRIEKLDSDYQQLTNDFVTKTFEKAVNAQMTFVKTFGDEISEYLEEMNTDLEKSSSIQFFKSVHRNHQAFLSYSISFFEKKAPNLLAETKDILTDGLKDFQTRVGNYLFESPESIILNIQENKKEKNISIPLKKILSNHINYAINEESFNQLISIENSFTQMYTELKDIILNFNELFENLVKSSIDSPDKLKSGGDKILNEIKLLENKIREQIYTVRSGMHHTARNQIISFVSSSSNLKGIKEFKSKINLSRTENTEQLSEFPDQWHSNFTLINNSLHLDCFILLNQKLAVRIVNRTGERIVGILSEKALNPINELFSMTGKDNITGTISSAEIKSEGLLSVKDLFQETYIKISEFIEKFPVATELSDRKIDEIETKENRSDLFPVWVEPQKIARHTLDTIFFEPYYRMLVNLEKEVDQIMDEFREINSLIKFRYSNPEIQEDQRTQKNQDQLNFLHKLHIQLQKTKERLEHAMGQLNDQSESMIRNAFSPLFSHSILDSGKNIKNQIKERKGRKINLGISRRISKIKEKVNDQIVNLLYSKSSGMILAKKYLKEGAQDRTSISQILDLTEKLMPEKSTFAQIPIFYLNLFKSKSFINDDFWVPREEESIKIKSARKRHKEGHGGAILIIGEHGSGKTALTRWTTNHLFRKDHIFNVIPPVNGSVNPNDWLNSLRKAANSNETANEIAAGLPSDSVIVINDLELWWERSNDGYAVLEEIMKLVQNYSHRIFFILNCNIHSYRIINKIFPIEDNLLSIIECGPFDSKQIQQLVIKRHKASGLTIDYNNQTEENMLTFRMASLFNSYYNYSKGNPGIVLSSWLRNIKSVENQKMFISAPDLPNTEFLNSLDKDWLIVIAMFIQHKNMNVEKLAKIMTLSTEHAEIFITRFFNSGILTLREENFYTLNRYLEPFVVKVCIEKGII